MPKGSPYETNDNRREPTDAGRLRAGWLNENCKCIYDKDRPEEAFDQSSLEQRLWIKNQADYQIF